jgi:hypothetical protein
MSPSSATWSSRIESATTKSEVTGEPKLVVIGELKQSFTLELVLQAVSTSFC